MYINFQQNRVSRSVKSVHTNLFAKKNRNLHKLQLPIAIFEKIIISEMHHRITYIIMYFKFHPNRAKLCTQIYWQKMQVA